MTFEEQTQCKGYFGFGSGLNILKGQTGYCNLCSLKNECWDVHKERMAALFPELTEVFEKKVKELEAVGKGHEIVAWWAKKYQTYDPYVTGMVGNMEDGALIKYGGKPKNRGLGTLPYPFNTKN